MGLEHLHSDIQDEGNDIFSAYCFCASALNVDYSNIGIKFSGKLSPIHPIVASLNKENNKH
jgi:hypothetical protein